MCNTYGTWLRGDPRGWRTRHHREHVVGDYKHPPAPGTWEQTYRRSIDLMHSAPVRLNREQQRVAVNAVVGALQHHEIEVLALALDREHLHLLARFTDDQPRKWVGIAKKTAARELSDRGLISTGGIWGKRSQCEPIIDRGHQLAAFAYILRHGSKGATVWDFRKAALQ